MAYNYQPNLYGSVFPQGLPSMTQIPQTPNFGAPGGGYQITGAPNPQQQNQGINLLGTAMGIGKKWAPWAQQQYQQYMYGPTGQPSQALQTSFGDTPASWNPEFTQSAYSGGSELGTNAAAGYGADYGASLGADAAATGAGASGLGSLASGGAGLLGSMAGNYLGANTGIRSAVGGDSSGLSSFGQQAGSIAGQAVGGAFGGPAGSAAGGFLGSTFGGTYLDPVYDVASLFGGLF